MVNDFSCCFSGNCLSGLGIGLTIPSTCNFFITLTYSALISSKSDVDTLVLLIQRVVFDFFNNNNGNNHQKIMKKKKKTIIGYIKIDSALRLYFLSTILASAWVQQRSQILLAACDSKSVAFYVLLGGWTSLTCQPSSNQFSALQRIHS